MKFYIANRSSRATPFQMGPGQWWLDIQQEGGYVDMSSTRKLSLSWLKSSNQMMLGSGFKRKSKSEVTVKIIHPYGAHLANDKRTRSNEWK
jgi:hypothetical protein